jgi:tight adherence protein C
MQSIIDQIAIASGDEAFLRQLVVWLSATSVFVMMLGGAALAMGYFDPVRRRVGALSPNSSRSNNDYLMKVAKMVGPVAAFVLPQDQLERNKVMLDLYRAGFRTSTSLQAYYLIKTLLILVCPLAVVMASSWMPQASTSNVLMYAIFSSGVGMLLPNIALQKMVEKRGRALTNGFPDGLDLLVVCVESGLGLSAALQRVADELNVSHPDLSYELAMVNSEIRVGVQREQALKNLADRTGLEDIRGLVGLLVQTMRFGTGVADALRVYSEEFRDKRTQKAEEQAAKMGTKLVFPLVLFMFPIFFIVAIGPAVIRIIDAFGQV